MWSNYKGHCNQDMIDCIISLGYSSMYLQCLIDMIMCKFLRLSLTVISDNCYRA